MIFSPEEISLQQYLNPLFKVLNHEAQQRTTIDRSRLQTQPLINEHFFASPLI